MAKDRTNMVSLLDIGLLMNGNASNIVELGDGFTDLKEDWSPNSESKQYINQKNASNTIKGYELSIDAEREYLSDDVQTTVDDLFKKFPTGDGCNTNYYRFYKTDTVSTGVFNAIRVPVTVAPSSTGGAGGGTLVSAIQIHGNGDVEEGTITYSEGAWVFTPAA